MDRPLATRELPILNAPAVSTVDRPLMTPLAEQRAPDVQRKRWLW